MFWLCPAFVLAGVLAEPLFRFVFGEKWLPAVPYFQLLCVVGIMLPLHLYNLNIVNVKGRSDLFLKLEIIKKIVVVVGILVTLPIGIIALLIFQAFSAVLMYFVNSYFSGKFINYPVWEQLKDILPIVSLSIIVGLAILFLDKWFSGFSDIIRLLLGFGLGAGLYWMLSVLLKIEPLKDFKHIFQTTLLNRFAK